jgi:hypothetical protein
MPPILHSGSSSFLCRGGACPACSCSRRGTIHRPHSLSSSSNLCVLCVSALSFSLPSLFTVCRSTFNFKLSTINSLPPIRALRTAIPGCPLPRGTGQPRPHEKTFMTITPNAHAMVRCAENRTGCCGREGGGVYWRSFRKAPQQSPAIPRWRKKL